MLNVRLNDAIFWFGSYKVKNLKTKELIYQIKLSGGFISKLIVNISDINGEKVAVIKSPKTITSVYRQRMIDNDGNIIGEIEPRITMEKLMTDTKQTMTAYKSGGKNMLLKGLHVADIVFKGEKYLAESYWPGYKKIEVIHNNSVVLTLERKFILSEWLDYIILRNLMVEKCLYDVTVNENEDLENDYILLSLLVRQFFRHIFGEKN